MTFLLPKVSRYFSRRVRFVNFRFLSSSSHSLADHSTPADAAIRRFQLQRATSAPLSQVFQWSEQEDLLGLAQFVWGEIPIRIAHRISELKSLPYNLSSMPSIVHLRELYTQSFHLFRLHPKPKTIEDDKEFVRLLQSHLSQLEPAIPLLASGVRECMAQSSVQSELIHSCPFLNDFLDRFHSSRIGTRFLTGQYVELHTQRGSFNGKPKPKQKHVMGLIDDHCRPSHILQNASDEASLLCFKNYGKAPDVVITDEKNITFRYVPTYLKYILFELLKNSMRAVCETYPNHDESDLPPINVVMVDGEADITIKISDIGGGISRENINKIWWYSFTTVPIESLSPDPHDPTKAPMAGFGYGLPISRLYARYFGGDLQVISMHGFGTDAFVYLNKLGISNENLPYEYDEIRSKGP